ncbi:MAG: winged helix-turn-helix domain-containing protein [Candidatus Nanohaloarchaea archaeon]|nr:winged helix-turn-helix domain-containing protein [Candidatus Nanohaloarchaea archaeon]
MDETVLFYLSDGGDVRLKILELVRDAEENDEGMYLTKLADELDMSHVGARNHLQLLLDEGYVRYKNPDGKPKFLEITDEGERVLEDR